jgi:uncharacterized protein YktB (UPF0637 family)
VTDGQKPIVIKTLADEYELSEDHVREIYTSTKNKLESELGFSIKRVKSRG